MVTKDSKVLESDYYYRTFLFKLKLTCVITNYDAKEEESKDLPNN